MEKFEIIKKFLRIDAISLILFIYSGNLVYGLVGLIFYFLMKKENITSFSINFFSRIEVIGLILFAISGNLIYGLVGLVIYFLTKIEQVDNFSFLNFIIYFLIIYFLYHNIFIEIGLEKIFEKVNSPYNLNLMGSLAINILIIYNLLNNISKKTTYSPLKKLNVNNHIISKKFFLFILLIFAILILMVIFDFVVLGKYLNYEDTVPKLYLIFYNKRYFINLIIYSIYTFFRVALLEEIIFRGVLINFIENYFQKLKINKKEIKGFFIINTIFVLSHQNIYTSKSNVFIHFVILFIVGFILWGVQKKFKNIFLTAAIHTFYNVLV